MSGIVRSLGRRIARLLPRIPYPVVKGPLRGSRFILGSFDGAGGGASVYWDLSEPEQTRAFTRIVKPGYKVFDIGANVGYYTILASRLVGAEGLVASFEPVPRNLAFLERHIELNKCANVRVFPYACSDRNGTVDFGLGTGPATGGLHGRGHETLVVDSVSLDELSDREGLAPDVLKIDVEGAEELVLIGASGMIQKALPAIFLSTHSPELRGACLERLEALGYRVKSLLECNDPHEFVAVHPDRPSAHGRFGVAPKRDL